MDLEVGVLWNSTRYGHDQLHAYPLPRTQNKPQAQMHNLGSNATARWACPQGREHQRGTQARVRVPIPVGPVPVRAKGCIGEKPHRQNQSGQGHQNRASDNDSHAGKWQIVLGTAFHPALQQHFTPPSSPVRASPPSGRFEH